VSDAFGNGVPQISVTFTAPASAPSGTFSGGVHSVTVATASNGVATAPTFTADSSVGEFTVTAEAAGLGSAQFSLTSSDAVSPGFTVSASPAALTIVQGQSASTMLTLTPEGGFAGTINLSCSGLPANAQCAFVPAQAVMTGNNAAVAVTLTLNTAGSDGQLSYVRPGTFRRIMHGGLDWRFTAMFAVLMLAVIFARRDLRDNPARGVAAGFRLLLAMLIGIALTACGGVASSVSSAHSAATAPGNYTVSVNAGTQTTVVMINVVQQ
jgi:hypothetical protein